MRFQSGIIISHSQLHVANLLYFMLGGDTEILNCDTTRYEVIQCFIIPINHHPTGVATIIKKLHACMHGCGYVSKNALVSVLFYDAVYLLCDCCSMLLCDIIDM